MPLWKREKIQTMLREKINTRETQVYPPGKTNQLFCGLQKKALPLFSLTGKDEMIVTFDKEYLRELYETGKSDKKHRFQPDIINRYKKGIDYLKSAGKIEDLFLLPSLRYEVLKGDKAGISSIRVNNQYRIEFTVHESIITVCNILELSNHYK